MPAAQPAHYATHRRVPGAGFTLIELLAVIAIICLLTALTVTVSGFARQASAKARTRSELEKLHNSLEEYRLKNGTYPATLSKPDFVSTLPAGVDLIDDWGRGYLYATQAAFRYSLYSKGPIDKKSGSDFKADDIYSGK